MKNRDFIRGCVNGTIAAPRRTTYREASNVLFDGEHVYSYGSHYPLLMRLETEQGVRWIRNDRGYSSSTGRHISEAGPYADASVHLGRGMRPDYADIRKSAEAELVEQRDYIEATREKAIKRPYHAAFYQRGIDRAEDRMQNLHRVISICDDAEAFALERKSA